MLVWVKPLHVACAVISASFFVIRALWMLQGSPRLRLLWVRVAPHAIDTVLLLSGVYLAALWNWATWILIKLVAVVIYIGLGLVALRGGANPTLQRASLVGALVAVACVFMIAMIGRSF
jgi:uncharacterized membrane protein SirB2